VPVRPGAFTPAAPAAGTARGEAISIIPAVPVLRATAYALALTVALATATVATDALATATVATDALATSLAATALTAAFSRTNGRRSPRAGGHLERRLSHLFLVPCFCGYMGGGLLSSSRTDVAAGLVPLLPAQSVACRLPPAHIVPAY